jgi:LmbE family N-acetylglucosaminyl deacetylase/SAM-dependent methyltransferase
VVPPHGSEPIGRPLESDSVKRRRAQRPGPSAHRSAVQRDFDRRTDEWRSIYRGETFHDHTISRRMELALALIDRLGGSGRSLDVGCGAGQLVVEMGRRGYKAHGCDISERMVAESRALLEREGLSARVEQAEAEHLPYPSGNFDWVTALGVIEYLPSPAAGMSELRRVLAPGGRLIVTAPNPYRLAYVLDPVGILRARIARPKVGYGRHYFSPGRLRRLIEFSGLKLVELEAHGLGPLTLAGYPVTSDRRAIALGERLERNLPPQMVRLLGSNLIALAKKPDTEKTLVSVSRVSAPSTGLRLRVGQRLPAGLRRVLNTIRGIETPHLIDRPPGRRLAVLAPHPDDELLGCGGALLKHLAAGDRVSIVFVTSGERTAGLTGLPQSESVALREAEARESAKLLGVAESDLVFLRHPDGDVGNSLGAALERTLIDLGPDLVYVPYPLDAHRDHVATTRMFADALPKVPSVSHIALYEVWTALYPNCIVDITDEIDAKLEALSRYQTALGSVDYLHTSRGLAAFRSAQVLHGRGYAEAFVVLAKNRFAELMGTLSGG